MFLNSAMQWYLNTWNIIWTHKRSISHDLLKKSSFLSYTWKPGTKKSTQLFSVQLLSLEIPQTTLSAAFLFKVANMIQFSWCCRWNLSVLILILLILWSIVWNHSYQGIACNQVKNKESKKHVRTCRNWILKEKHHIHMSFHSKHFTEKIWR